MTTGRTFDSMVEQEMSIQSACVDMEGGKMPTCLDLFDRYLLCYSIPNQFKSLHRFGTITECQRKFQDFKFCMSLKSMPEDKRKQAWIERRAQWWAGRRLGPSSEDVWEVKSYPEGTAERMAHLQK